MSRLLLVVPPLVGHVNPLVGVAAELTARGHTVAWAGLPELVGQLAGEDTEVFPCAIPPLAPHRPPELRGPAALKFLWQEFLIPLAEAMAPDIEAACRRFRPDVLVVDQQAVAGALVAERLGLPWATSATTSAEFTGALDGMPLVEAWVRELLDGLRGRFGDPAADTDPRFSPHLALAFTTAELAGEPTGAGTGRVRFVGPSLAARPTSAAFPWQWLDPARATVLVTLGTANTDAGAAFLTVCQQALQARSDRLQAVIVDPAGVLADLPPNRDVLALPAVPQLSLLPGTDAVVCHAGHNTVCEALWHGVPLVVAPIRDDQPVVAQQVATSGAGVRIRFGRTDADRLGRAVDAVLDDPTHQDAARRIADSFRAAGGASRAADHLEALAATDHPPTASAPEHAQESR
ncbi:glycosyltransferase [Kitasatospora paracochleata]|uniref:UDP:flavonoid glycosyltransferase YjiC (YdhE family) n=1 Tax=Kitasatospora paracochleata TaxID=58354 RepID=A0ABT1IW83_9ACTN|nr:glycosyltransferase [Kitasatospora paracochleata]MCP2309413.1 UDP:flavonoid glycosyltransferase YjiC (YdhE family) [Kitasatospora paracochleata]